MQGEVIGKEVDSKGSDVTIRYCPEFGGSPVVSQFFRLYAKSIDEGLAQPFVVVSNKAHKVIYGEIDGVVAGFFVFEIQEQPEKTSWVTFNAVDDPYRQRGLYTILRKHFEIISKKIGCKKTAANVHVDNKVQIKASEKVGRLPVFYRMEKVL